MNNDKNHGALLFTVISLLCMLKAKSVMILKKWTILHIHINWSTVVNFDERYPTIQSLIAWYKSRDSILNMKLMRGRSRYIIHILSLAVRRVWRFKWYATNANDRQRIKRNVESFWIYNYHFIFGAMVFSVLQRLNCWHPIKREKKTLEFAIDLCNC